VSDDAQTELNDFTPRLPAEQWQAISVFVRHLAALAAPQTTYTAHLLASALTHFVRWAHLGQGYPLKAELLLSRKVINFYTEQMVERGTLSAGTVRNRRSLLERVAIAVLPGSRPPPTTPLNARVNVPPYTDFEAQQIRWWMAGQTNPARMLKATAIVCLGFGAGLRSREISSLKKRDIVRDTQGLIVVLPDRQVPVVAEWAPALRAHLDMFDDDDVYVFSGQLHPPTANVVSRFTGNIGGDLQPRADRMRATWLVWQLTERTNMRALMSAAGVSKFENLSRYLEFIPELDSRQYRRQLSLQARTHPTFQVTQAPTPPLPALGMPPVADPTHRRMHEHLYTT
jgi:integrase